MTSPVGGTGSPFWSHQPRLNQDPNPKGQKRDTLLIELQQRASALYRPA